MLDNIVRRSERIMNKISSKSVEFKLKPDSFGTESYKLKATESSKVGSSLKNSSQVGSSLKYHDSLDSLSERFI